MICMKLSIYETISHIVGSYPKRKELNRTHDNVAEAIHWELVGNRRFEQNERCYDHVRRKVFLKWRLQIFVGLQSSNRPWNWGQEIGFGGHWQERQELSNYRCGNSRGWTGERNGIRDRAGETFENCRVFLGFPRLLLLPGARENTSLNIISRTKIQY